MVYCYQIFGGTCYLLLQGIHLLFYPEDLGSSFLEHVEKYLLDYTVSYPRRPNIHSHRYENLKSHVLPKGLIYTVERRLFTGSRLWCICYEEMQSTPISFIMSVCPTVSPVKHHENRWTYFHEMWRCWVSLKYGHIFQSWLKSNSSNGHYTWIPTCVSARISTVTGWTFIRKINVSRIRFTEQLNMPLCPE
jgi:hypothetical protein